MAISLVGTPTTGSAIDGNDITLSLPSGLQENDVVYVVSTQCDSSASGGTSSSGWSRIVDNRVSTQIYGQAFRKIMGATPDTDIVLSGDDQTTADSQTAIAFAYRGVDLITPEDGVTPTVSSGVSTNPDPPSITPNTTGAVSLTAAGTRIIDTTGTAPPTGYGNFTQVSSDDNRDTTTYVADKPGLTGGVAENPSAFTGVSSAAWHALTIVIKPAADSPPEPISFPLPQVSKRSESLKTHLDGARLPLFNRDQMYVREFDWPLPKRPFLPNRTWLNTFIPAAPAKPIFPPIWANPQPLRLVDRTWVRFSLPLEPSAVPIFPKMWPLPQPGRWIDRTWTSFSFLDIPGDKPLFATAWNLPTRSKWVDRTWLSIFIPEAPTGVPIFPPLWERPRGAKQPDRTWTNFSLPIVPAGIPVFPKIWTLPFRQRPVALTLLSTFIPPQGMPARQTDWPLPQAPARARTLLTWTSSFVPPTTAGEITYGFIFG